MTTKFAKFGSVFAGVAMALSFVSPVSAATVAELQAQINALMAQLSAMSGGAAVSSSFTTDLTVGSKGADVTALQQALVAKGFLTMPSGVAYGYFGNLTKSAVAAWQAANGITPAVGYFGPKSRAAFGGVAGTPATPATPAATGITTPGAEGTLTVTAGTVSNSTIYSGDTLAPVLVFKAKALSSDIAIQRVKIDLGTASSIYSKVYSKIYLVDEAGATIASSDLNSNTVVKDSDDIYYITLSGFSSVVPKDTTKTYTLKVDVRSISTGSADLTSHTVRLAVNGVRGVDGAGIDQYSPAAATTVSKAVTTAATLSDSASVTLSTGANTPLTQEVVAATGASNDQADKVTLLTFDIKASKDNVTLTDLAATVTSTGGTAATASSTYLYVGDTLVGSASLALGTATFSDINVAIAKDTTKTFTLKADIQAANSVQTTFAASVAAAGMTAENSAGDSITGGNRTGSATGNSILVRNDGPIFSLVSKTITYTPAATLTGATSTAKATFVVRANAVGSDIIFGTQAASTTFGFGTYKASTLTTLLNASTTSYTIPSSGVVTSGLQTGQAFKISENGTADISVDFLFEGRTAAGVLLATDSYAVGVESIKWSLTGNNVISSTFMSGKTDWRTSTITMP